VPARSEPVERIGTNCPNCGVMVSPGFDRCPSCGADVTVRGDPFAHFEEAGDFTDDEEIEGKAPPAQVQRCPRCGDVVDDTMPRCRRCGLPFPTRAPAPEMPPAGPPTRREVPDIVPPEPEPPAPAQPPPEPAPPPPAPAPPAAAPSRPEPDGIRAPPAGPPPKAAAAPPPGPPSAAPRARPAIVPRVPLKTLPADQRRALRERFMKKGLYILAGLGAADLVVWLLPLLWTNFIVNLSMVVAKFIAIGFVLGRAQSHLGASVNELSEYERKRGMRVLVGLLLISVVPLHEVLGLYPLGYTGTWGTYGGFVGMINPAIMLAGSLIVAFNVQQSRERLGYFVIWRNGAVLLMFPPAFALLQVGVPVLLSPEWFHATLGMVGGTVMVIALVLRTQRDRQFAELENALKWGDEYAARGQPEQALAQYDSAINMAHTLFSHLIFNIDNPSAQVRVPPAYSEPWFRKGRLLAKIGRTKKALAIFDMILEMDPQNQVALLNEAELLSRSGEHEGALRAVDRVLAIVPDHPDGLRLKATFVEAARLAAEERQSERDAEDAESVFGPSGRARPAPEAAAPAPPPPGEPPEGGFETI